MTWTMFHKRIQLCDSCKLPPFKNNSSREISLLQNTSYCRDGRQRLPTPDKLAIMELSNSFQKRRLGKQQRILTDITKRCREQDVSDLSDALTSKCKLKEHRNERKYTIIKRPLSDPSPNSRSETTYKSFPARNIFRRTRNDLSQKYVHYNKYRINGGFHTVRTPRPSVELIPGLSRQTTDVWAEPTFHTKPIDPEPKIRNKTDPCISLKSTTGTVTKDDTIDIDSEIRQH